MPNLSCLETLSSGPFCSSEPDWPACPHIHRVYCKNESTICRFCNLPATTDPLECLPAPQMPDGVQAPNTKVNHVIFVIAHPDPARASPGRLVVSTKRTVSSTEARLAFAVLTTERK